jgi:hypothetical protein
VVLLLVVKGAEGADGWCGAAGGDVSEAPAVVALGVWSEGEEPLGPPSAGVEDDRGGKERDLGGVDGDDHRACRLEGPGRWVGVEVSGGRIWRRPVAWAIEEESVVNSFRHLQEGRRGDRVDGDLGRSRGRLEGQPGVVTDGEGLVEFPGEEVVEGGEGLSRGVGV